MGRADLARRAAYQTRTLTAAPANAQACAEPPLPRGMVFYSSTQRLVDAIAATLLSRDARVGARL